MRNRSLYLFFANIFVVILSFLLIVLIKPTGVTHFVVIKNDLVPFLVFLGIYLIISILFGKYEVLDDTTFNRVLIQILKSNFIAAATVSLLIYFFHLYYISRLIVFGTIVFATVFEFMFYAIFFTWRQLVVSRVIPEEKDEIREYQVHINQPVAEKKSTTIFEKKVEKQKTVSPPSKPFNFVNKELIIEQSDEKVFDFIASQIDIFNSKSIVLLTTTRFNIYQLQQDFYNAIVNLRRINDIRRINKFFEAVNFILPVGGHFIGCVESKNLRKKRVLRKFPVGLNYILYFIDFIYKRVMPKLPILKKVYFTINQGKNRVLSKQETYGRLYSCGFKVITDNVINNHIYFVVEKIKKPVFDEHPSYGPLFKMRRVGKDGKIIRVYKFRTMYPYSEYLQEYIYEHHSLEEGGKFNRDIRITTIGKIMRKFWIDELPMFVNLFRGDLKLVGVRPLSAHYLSLYDKELQDLRIKFKPGLIPPYYADLPKNLEEIMDSEKRYLQAYQKSPYLTDIKYLFRALYNIIFKRARSK